MPKQIIVDIDPLGNVQIDAQGFKGQGCKDATRALERAVAAEGQVETTFKPEWQETEDEHELHELHLGG